MDDGWQPIETAPKDGSVFLAMFTDFCGATRYRWDDDQKVWCSSDDKLDENEFGGWYSLWLPFPDIPIAASIKNSEDQYRIGYRHGGIRQAKKQGKEYIKDKPGGD
jgi:hypothetical protein